MSRIIIVLCLFLATHTLHARITEPTFGLYGHFGLAYHKVNSAIFSERIIFGTSLTKDTGNSNFYDGQGSIWGIGCLYEHPFGKTILLSFRTGYSEYSGRVLITEITSRGSDPINKHSADMQLHEFAAELLTNVKVYEELSLLVGFRVGYITENAAVIATRYNTTENIDVKSYTLPNDKDLLTSYTLGLAYNFKPFTTDNILIAPEVLFSINMTNFIRGKEWTISPYRFGLVVKYVLPE